MATVKSPETRLIPASEPYWNLGTYTRAVSTSSPDCQVWFNRGLVWIYGFHHEEAAVCFEQAIAYDPKCLMGYWGLVYALSGNYNFNWVNRPLDFVTKRLEKIAATLAAAEKAEDGASHVEKQMFEALRTRNPPPDNPRVVDKEERRTLFQEYHWAFQKAMKKVYLEHRHDLDVLGAYADSIAVLAPWKLWDIPNGAPNPDVPTLELERVLEEGLALPGGREHPYLLHLYIHSMELSPTPEKAIFAADRLLDLVPDASHLIHMASHIDMLMGDYRRAIYSNAKALEWDREYQKVAPPDFNYRFYGLHNYDCLIYAAMFSAQWEVAWAYTLELEASFPESIMATYGDDMEVVYSGRFHVMVRFGKWDEILEMPFREDRQLYSVVTIMQHYARGIAFSTLGKVEEAEAELEGLLGALATLPATRILYPNMASDVLPIAEWMLKGELEYRKANYDGAFTHLRKAIHLYDHLTYGEPWGWMMPVRHAYAALQLEQGNVEEAAKTYAADLGFDPSVPRAHQHPRNVWALHGYRECLRRQGKEELAKVIESELRVALEVADVPIESSCFCRLTGEKGERLYHGEVAEEEGEGEVDGPRKKAKLNGEANGDCCS